MNKTEIGDEGIIGIGVNNAVGSTGTIEHDYATLSRLKEKMKSPDLPGHVRSELRRQASGLQGRLTQVDQPYF